MWRSIRIGFYMGIYFSFSFGVLTLSCWRSLGKRVVYSIGPAGLGGGKHQQILLVLQVKLGIQLYTQHGIFSCPWDLIGKVTTVLGRG